MKKTYNKKRKEKYNQRRKIYYSSMVRKTVNLYLNTEQEKIWNNLPQNYTFSEKVEYFINYYIVNNKGDNKNE
ncbi:hypothetical protein [Spiroplasma phoeniceum]|uniref:Uncharacterized protein n=2 Tax=Spiroplasma phoeniceum P40 TaxID=1276259 RepID=A0A345DP19_9MOLU|nr:hypothetical protein [Spiroplasma phoeniceum]AXF95753.1 hypothetical protein SDAV_00768 [Spiroplasma phoeniceum P40]AXF95957.1 hypothetical protein SDAV_00977 [Spiroplasma phoeniceum P40]